MIARDAMRVAAPQSRDARVSAQNNKQSDLPQREYIALHCTERGAMHMTAEDAAAVRDCLELCDKNILCMLLRIRRIFSLYFMGHKLSSWPRRAT